MEFLRSKIKLGRWIFEEVDCKQIDKHGRMILIDKNKN